MQEFWNLAAELIKEQGRVMPNFRAEVDPFLKKALPAATNEEIERVKDYFIQNRPAPKSK